MPASDMKLTLLAKSSSGDPYRVDVDADQSGIRMFCHCPAGVLRQVCKHKIALAKGDVTMLADAAQAAELKVMQSGEQYPTLIARIGIYEREISGLEKRKTEIHKEEKALKARLAQEFVRGIARQVG